MVSYGGNGRNDMAKHHWSQYLYLLHPCMRLRGFIRILRKYRTVKEAWYGVKAGMRGVRYLDDLDIKSAKAWIVFQLCNYSSDSEVRERFRRYANSDVFYEIGDIDRAVKRIPTVKEIKDAAIQRRKRQRQASRV